jgi:MerR family copper efflux transcriptional regulator
VGRYRTKSHERSQAREPTTLPLIACSLDTTGQKQRLAAWSSLLREAAQREETADGVRYTFVAANELESRLRTLAAAEKECCAFLNFDVVRRPDEIEMTVTAPPNAVAALHFIFSAS